VLHHALARSPAAARPVRAALTEELLMKKVPVTGAAVWALSSGVARAAEGGPEGLGEMHGVMPLVYLVGGVAAMGIVIWLGLKLLNRK
jgi:hypothetical protein